MPLNRYRCYRGGIGCYNEIYTFCEKHVIPEFFKPAKSGKLHDECFFCFMIDFLENYKPQLPPETISLLELMKSPARKTSHYVELINVARRISKNRKVK